MIPSRQSVLYTSDVPIPGPLNAVFFFAWSILLALGGAVALVAKEPVLGVSLVALPTFLGMVIKPTFALSLMMLVLPFGTGIAIPGVFTLNKGIGLVLAISFALNFFFRRPCLTLRNRTVGCAVAYSVWVILSSMMSPYFEQEALRSLTQLQLLGLFLIVYLILNTNGERSFVWGLRSYIVGTAGSLLVTLMMGTQFISAEKASEGRYVATLGAGQIDANHFGALVAIAFLSIIYLIHRDTRLAWRIVYIAALSFLGIMLIKIGSRGVLASVLLSIIFASVYEIKRNPKTAIGVAILIVITVSTSFIYLHNADLDERLTHRLTDMEYAKSSLAMRLGFIDTAVQTASQWPFGTGYFAYFEKTGQYHYPHTDLFFVLGIYRVPGVLMFIVFMGSYAYRINQMPPRPEKLFSKLIFFFIVLSGLTTGFAVKQFFWAFLGYILPAERVGVLFESKKYQQKRNILSSGKSYESFGNQP